MQRIFANYSENLQEIKNRYPLSVPKPLLYQNDKIFSILRITSFFNNHYNIDIQFLRSM